MNFEIKTNFKQAEQALKLFGKRAAFKFRFVLKHTSRIARDEGRKRINRAFKPRSSSTSLWVQRQMKSSPRVGKDLTAIMWVTDKAKFLEQQETGGLFRARGKFIGVPTDLPGRTARGRIKKGQRPSKVIKRKRVYQTKKGIFIRERKRVRGKRGKMIKNRTSHLLYTKAKTVRKKKRLYWYKTLKQTIDKVFERELEKEIQDTFNHIRLRSVK